MSDNDSPLLALSSNYSSSSSLNSCELSIEKNPTSAKDPSFVLPTMPVVPSRCIQNRISAQTVNFLFFFVFLFPELFYFLLQKNCNN